ncbi:hypothetical protein PFAG_01536 [Plasmodium falciparum Santa Lucia]|uniref:Uncharacterized protein n=3 Tax=Plasmodium falciparum TaxID=5833 RepID=A0A024XBJ3_PLAFC|nr:hypothetical protein PFNF135_01687 [Plasmodium falciparum NF135/5.C10]ETW62568.1 hypothetical protein PFMC_01583 [Plasmodium falciparum CAMP/Malaysia]EUT89383.1 hypothetical protein PFAG_01536 [Plasmodium falciparum Santa Lucia]
MIFKKKRFFFLWLFICLIFYRILLLFIFYIFNITECEKVALNYNNIYYISFKERKMFLFKHII